jgi:hypothetical protein
LKIKLCTEEGCHNAQTTKDYCRLHYVKNWKLIKEKEQKRAADKLNKYVEGIVKKNPDRYVDAIRRDLKNDKAIPGFLDSQGGETEETYEGTGFFVDEEGMDQVLANIKVDKL